MDGSERTQRLSALTSAFYRRTCHSFSATRQMPWRGWDELWGLVAADVERAAPPVDIADAACGNLRFARFLKQKMSKPFMLHGFDDCEPLLREGLVACREAGIAEGAVRTEAVDLAESLRRGSDPFAGLPLCALAATFGFMHHLPSEELRLRLLEALAAHTAPGGFVAASFWRFADDDRLRAKAEEATARALASGTAEGLALAAGDYVLGWQDDAEALRYCHHFTENEIDRLSAALAPLAREETRFSADGKSGRLNRYVVWRRHA